MKAWPFVGILVVQTILLLAHWFLYSTWIAFWPGLRGAAELRIALLVLAFSFVAAALVSFRFAHPLIALFYKAAVVWLGFLNYLFLAAIASWTVWLAVALGQRHAAPGELRPWIGGAFAGLAVLTGIYGLVNARCIRVRRHTLRLADLPAAWQGRKAVVMSDLHLGNVNGAGFSGRMARLAARLKPDVVFVPGDLFDGVKADLDRLLDPWKELKPPLGVYFSTGNHEEFGDSTHYTQAIARAGIRVLANQRVTVDGLDIAGISYRDSTYPIRVRALLEGMAIGNGQPSILLHHAPTRLPIAEHAGVSLQLSGHTHGGQLFPFTWIARRVFGEFTCGLHRFGALQVYTSSGAGTWGPPMRVGARPEIVVLEFESIPLPQ